MNRARKWDLVRFVITALHLWFGWLLFTATLEPLSLALGAVLAAAVASLTFRLFIDQSETQRRSLLPRVPLLFLLLLVVIIRMYIASFKVLYNVVRGRINPRIVHFRTRLRSDMARVALTSIITMTPGTVTLMLDDDHLIVHWLDAQTRHSGYAGELIKGRFERILARIWI